MNEQQKGVVNNTIGIIADVAASAQSGKKWYESKTVRVNIIALIALGIQMKTGFVIDPSFQALGLSALNLVLRKVTNTNITF